MNFIERERKKERERERQKEKDKEKETDRDFSHTCNNCICQDKTDRHIQKERDKESYWILLVIVAYQTMILVHPIPFL